MGHKKQEMSATFSSKHSQTKAYPHMLPIHQHPPPVCGIVLCACWATQQAIPELPVVVGG